MSCFLYNIIGIIYMYYYIFYFDWNFFIFKLIFFKIKMFSSRKYMVLCFRIDFLFLRGENDDFDFMVVVVFFCNYEIFVKE